MKRSTLLVLGALLALGVLLAYSNHFRNGFHFDDAHTIVNNAYIRNIGNLPRFFRDGTTFSSLPANQSYRPLVTATLAVDYHLGGGLDPFWFHLSTFLLYLVQGLFMYLLFSQALRVAAPGADHRGPALFAVAVYLLHPVNAETVNYIIARSDTLSTLGVVISLALYACAPRSRRHHLYLLPAAVGALAKPVAGVFAPLLFLWVLLFGEAAPAGDGKRAAIRSRLYGALRASAPAFLLLGALLAFIRSMDPKTWTPGGTSYFRYAITQPFVILHYFKNFFLPLNLSADTDWAPLSSVLDPRLLLGTAFCALLVGGALAAARLPRWRPVSFGLLWFLVALVPTSFAVPLAEVMNDHRVFLPYVGLTLAVTWAAALLLERLPAALTAGLAFRRALPAACLGLLALCAWGTHRRNEVWRTEETLWRDVTEKSPKNGRGWMNYGLTLMAKGDYAGAEANYLTALKLVPAYPELHVNLGIVRAAGGRLGEAEASFKRAIQLDPVRPNGYFYYARFLAQQDRGAEAAPLLERTLSLAPAHLDARHLLLRVYAEGGETRRLTALAEETLRLAPDDPEAGAALAAARSGRPNSVKAQPEARPPVSAEDHLEVSLREYRAGRFRDCIRAAEKALELRPGYALAYNNICAARAELGEWDQAVMAGEKAVALDPANRLAQNNLAWARSGRGRKR